MSVLEKPRSLLLKELRAAVRGLKPGESFSLDRPITIEEFCALGEEPRNIELVNGIIAILEFPTDAHEELFGWLQRVLSTYVEARRLGRVRGSRSGVVIGSTSLSEPDLIFFRNEHLDRMQPSGRHGPPDFAVEIVDADAARRDAVRKQAQYQEAGVTELWVVDLPRKELRAFMLVEGAYRRLEIDPAGEIEAQTIEGFRLQVGWLFQGPNFPSSLEVVTALVEARHE